MAGAEGGHPGRWVTPAAAPGRLHAPTIPDERANMVSA
jgi:hypothetical protein